MQLKIFTALCAVCASSVIIAGETFPLFDLSKSTKGFNAYGNLNMEQIEDSGVKCLNIRIKDPNGQGFGGFQLFAIPQPPDAKKYDRLVLYMKGSGAKDSIAIVLADRKNKVEWCWNGRPWDKAAAITLENADWHKRTFLFKDMVCISKKKAPFSIGNVNNLQLVFGINKKRDLNVGFQLAEISVAAGETEGNSPPETEAKNAGQR